MGTTSRGYPYPEGSDLVIGGDDAIQALAEAVSADMNNSLQWVSHLDFSYADSSQAIPATGVAVGWTGTSFMTPDFTYDGAAGAAIYLGPLRPFIIAASVAIRNGGTPARSSVELRVNGVPIMGSGHEAHSATFTANHSITVPAHLQSGDIVDVIAYANPAGDLDPNAFRIYPIGPVL